MATTATVSVLAILKRNDHRLSKIATIDMDSVLAILGRKGHQIRH